MLHIRNASVKLNSAIDVNGSRHAHATCAASTLSPLPSSALPSCDVHSLAAKPAADTTFGLTCLLLNGLVEFVNLLVQLFGGIFPKLFGFALRIG